MDRALAIVDDGLISIGLEGYKVQPMLLSLRQSLFNHALLRKLIGCYMHERRALWRVIVDGVLMRFMVRMGWAFGRVGVNFQVILYLR
jgi:hypothetical protein